MKYKVKEDKLKLIASILIIVLIFGVITLIVMIKIDNIERDIEICKELGYDGVQFTSKYTSEVECSNFTELQRARMEEQHK